MDKVSQWLLKILGWKVTGWDPLTLNKYVLIVIPHTSNWDFPLGLIIRSALNWEINFVGKESLFRWPFKKLLKKMGGYPVDRSRSTNYVENVAELFKNQSIFRLCIAPEGTRSPVTKIKTGFYYIAKAAQVPIIMVAFDYSKKEVRIAEPLNPTHTFPEIYEKMRFFYRGTKGKIPENGFDFDLDVRV